MNHPTIHYIHQIAEKLAPIYTNQSEREQTAWWLLQAITKKQEAELLAQKEIKLSQEQEKQLHDWITLHVEDKKPLQYILGSVPFDGLEIICEPPTLIPRPETEEWTIRLSKQLRALPTTELCILDIATGSGCIALALAQALPHAHIYGTDISQQALTLAKKNAKHNNISNVTFLYSDVFKNIPEDLKFDLIVSNPPYISAKEWKDLEPSVTEWEDKQALVAEHDGFAIIQEIIDHAPEFIHYNEKLYLAGIPQVIIEIGYRQGNRAQELMHNALYTHVHIEKDLEDKDRVVVGRVPRATLTGPEK